MRLLDNLFTSEISHGIFPAIIVHSLIVSWFKSSRCQFLYQRPATEKLAPGAEIGATVLNRDPLDGAAANGAGLASPMSDLGIRVGCA
jgi:hypothetical protein